jgi:O-antigen ligase
VICLAYATYQYVFRNDSHYFFYHPLAETIGLHAVYMALYICFCFFIVLYLYQDVVSGSARVQKIMFYGILIYFVIFLFLLSARAVTLAFSMITFSGIIVYSYKRKKLWQAAVLMTLLGCVFALLIYVNPESRERFKEAINYKSQYSIDKQWGGRAERLLMWDCSGDIIKDNLFFGVGTGDAQDELQECYKVKNYGSLLYYPDVQYNAHNQYLQSTIDLGILGLFLLLLCLFLPAYKAFKDDNYLFLSFIALFSIACLTESMLEANKGIIFFTFFSSLFWFQQRAEKRRDL